MVAVSLDASSASSRVGHSQAVLACELADPQKVIPKIFGLPHVSFVGRETTTPLAGHATYCNIGAWSGKPPSPATIQALTTGSTFAHRVPPGIAVVVAGTQVGAQNPVATYDLLAGAMAKQKLRSGGGVIAVPGHGAARHYAVWIGSRDHARGIWLVGNGVIEVFVESPAATAPKRLLALAQELVPQFIPFTH